MKQVRYGVKSVALTNTRRVSPVPVRERGVGAAVQPRREM